MKKEVIMAAIKASTCVEYHRDEKAAPSDICLSRTEEEHVGKKKIIMRREREREEQMPAKFADVEEDGAVVGDYLGPEGARGELAS